ncbi:UNVERIFIED_ORG: hypothetical protein M2382_001602 [Enterobacter sp. BIGb0239]
MKKMIKNKVNQELNLRFERLPRHIRRWALYLHYTTGVAVEIIVVTLLAFLGLACQDLFCVQLGNKQRFPLALYQLLLSRSGSGKSRIYRLLKIPVEQQERRFEDEYCVELEGYERRVIIWQAEFKVLNKLYKKALSQGGDIAETSKKLEGCISRRPLKPVRKSIILTNPTSEALAKEIGMGYQNKALFNDEAAGVYTSSLYNDPTPFNTFWCWDKATINRVSRDSFVIENYVFSSFLMMQPHPYDNSSKRKRASIRFTGLLARTLMIDMEQITELYTINDHSAKDESLLQELYSIMSQLMDAGVKRRENGDEYIALTLAPNAQDLMDETSLSLQQQMKPGGALYHYDDIAARFIEQSLRIAGIIQVTGDPGSTEITRENLLSALNLTDWFVNHSITKIDSTRELSDEEKLSFWMESNLVKNGSYIFNRNIIIKKGPFSTRCSARLMPALEKLESKGKVQLYEEAGVNYVKFIGSKMDSLELAEKTNTPIYQAGSLTLSKLAIHE